MRLTCVKRRKLYYVPGLISILGLPILLFFYGPQDNLEPTVIRAVLPTDKKDVPGLIRFSRDYVYRSLKQKKIITVDLDQDKDNPYDDREDFRFYKKLHFISREIERLQFTNDTSGILKIQLGYSNTYGDFVWIFNQVLLYNVKRFAFVDDTYYFFSNPPIIHFPPFEIQIDLPPPKLPVVASPAKWDIFIERLKEGIVNAFLIARQNYIYVLAFLLLIVLPGMIWIRKRSMGSRCISKATL